MRCALAPHPHTGYASADLYSVPPDPPKTAVEGVTDNPPGCPLPPKTLPRIEHLEAAKANPLPVLAMDMMDNLAG